MSGLRHWCCSSPALSFSDSGDSSSRGRSPSCGWAFSRWRRAPRASNGPSSACCRRPGSRRAPSSCRRGSPPPASRSAAICWRWRTAPCRIRAAEPMKRESNRSKLLSRRAMLLAGGKIGLLAALAGRLYYLQVVRGGRFAMLADENRINIRLLAPPRGHIVDRFGVPLAVNRPTYRAVLVAEQAGDIPSTLDAVATLVPLTEADRRRVARDLRNKHSFVPIAIREDMTWDEMTRVEVNTLDLPGVSIEQGLIRHYPFGEETSHVVGYVAPVSEKELDSDDPLVELPDFRIGKSGVEKQYDLELRGTGGTSEVEVNAFGRIVRELAHEDGLAGQEIVLTIDMALQDFATKRCAAEGSASAVVLDSWTGEVLALASSPGYDPDAFASGLTPAQWKDLVENPYNPLTNKAIAGTYAPGSTFKPMMAMAGLEAGVLTPETEFFCPGYFH